MNSDARDALNLEVALEVWWRETDPDRPRLRYLARDDYGWMEWIDATPPADPAAALRLHRRIGALLAQRSHPSVRDDG